MVMASDETVENEPTQDGWHWAREHEGDSWEPTLVVTSGIAGWAAGKRVWLRPGEDGAQFLGDIFEWGPPMPEMADIRPSSDASFDFTGEFGEIQEPARSYLMAAELDELRTRLATLEAENARLMRTVESVSNAVGISVADLIAGAATQERAEPDGK